MSHAREGMIICVGWLLFMLLILTGCGGGGGGDDGDVTALPTTVTIAGKLDDGAAASPIASARCHFVDLDGQRHGQATTNANGEFDLVIPLDLQGFAQCAPSGLARLRLSTFMSSVGGIPGGTIPVTGRENVSPKTTVVSEILMTETSGDRLARKRQLLEAIDAQDPALTALIDSAVVLYHALLNAAIDVDFSNEVQGESDSGDSDGGVEGSSDDGTETSPISNAVCEFALELGGDAFVPSVLYDLFNDGVINRTNLAAIASQVNQELAGRGAEIVDAFAAFFSNGIGRPVRRVADEDGHYFLPLPPGIPGFVRCHPPDQPLLLLATFVRARTALEDRLIGQDVTPQTTVFSTEIASVLQEDVASIKDNYLNDIEGLRIRALREDDRPTSVELIEPSRVNDPEVGIVAFASTALFNALFQDGINASFPSALNDLVEKAEVDPDALEALGVSAEQATDVAEVVNDAIVTAEAEDALDTELRSAVSTARILVKVAHAVTGDGLSDATVDIQDSAGIVQCENCPATTDASGEVLLTLTNVPTDMATPITVDAAVARGTQSAIANVVGFATVNVMIMISEDPPVNEAPTVSAGPSQTIRLPSGARLTGVVTDDGLPVSPGVITTLWTQRSGPGAVTFADASAVATTASFSVAGSYVLRLTADDGELSDFAEVTIMVLPENMEPTANAGPNQNVEVGETVTLDGSGSSDVDGDPLTFQWTLTSAPAGSRAALSNPTASTLTFVADVEGTYVVQLVVNDGQVDSSPDIVVIETGNNSGLQCGDLVSGSILAASEVDRFTFTGAAGDVVAVTVTGAQMSARVFGPSGAAVTGFFQGTQVVVTLSESGTHVIEMVGSSFTATGDYSLGLECLAPPSSDAVALNCGSLNSGSISVASEADLFTFTGAAGDVVAVTVTGAQMSARVFGPSGAAVTGFFQGTQVVVTLSESGTHVIEMVGSSFTATGDYSLGLECL